MHIGYKIGIKNCRNFPNGWNQTLSSPKKKKNCKIKYKSTVLREIDSFHEFFFWSWTFLKIFWAIVRWCKKHHILELILSNVMKIYCFLYNILLLLSIKVKESGFYLHFYRLLSPILALGGQKVSSRLLRIHYFFYKEINTWVLFFFLLHCTQHGKVDIEIFRIQLRQKPYIQP